MYKKAMRVTKLVAIGLIVFPEPITTVIGVSMLAGAELLDRKLKARTKKAEKAFSN